MSYKNIKITTTVLNVYEDETTLKTLGVMSYLLMDDETLLSYVDNEVKHLEGRESKVINVSVDNNTATITYYKNDNTRVCTEYFKVE